MENEKISKIVTMANEALVGQNATVEEVEALIHSLVRHFLDNLTDIADVDYFQDRVNEIIDKYVDSHFEDAFDDKLN
ncbi:hypothetical protein MNBD_NITROSPINAE02-100 [hydrothermal vent metagenome]|uniref:Uncharacterized protein n=1 Tax=hydrothermal vent metagenome TaxID=652676 RepID=A0A3B1CHI6_9ZZZZ